VNRSKGRLALAQLELQSKRAQSGRKPAAGGPPLSFPRWADKMFRRNHPPTQPTLTWWHLCRHRFRTAGWRASITVALLVPPSALISALSLRGGTSMGTALALVPVLDAWLCIPIAAMLLVGGAALLLLKSTRRRGEEFILHGALLLLVSLGLMVLSGILLAAAGTPPYVPNAIPDSAVAIVGATYACLVTAYAAYLVTAHLRQRSRKAHGRCLHCAYPLSDSRVCPECGSPRPGDSTSVS
jgi:hypothetical protein